MAHGSFYNVNAIIKMLPENIQDARILDLGFGCGQISHTIITFSDKPYVQFKGEPYIIGLDIDPINIDIAKKWMPFYREIYLYDITNIPYVNNIINNLDVIICSEVVEHIKDKDKALKMIEYVSNKAKIVIFTCPNGNTLTHIKNSKEYDEHNSIWYEEDFKKFGFNTKLIKRIYWNGFEYELISIAMKFVNFVRQHNKMITETIFAWRLN